MGSKKAKTDSKNLPFTKDLLKSIPQRAKVPRLPSDIAQIDGFESIVAKL